MYNTYRKRWTEPQGRRSLCGEQTVWCGCAAVINQSRHAGADNLWSSDDEWRCAGCEPGQRADKEWHSAIHQWPDSRDRGCVESLYDPPSFIAKKEIRMFHGLVLNSSKSEVFPMVHLWKDEMSALALTAAVCFFKQNPWECLTSAAESQHSYYSGGQQKIFTPRPCLKTPERSTVWALSTKRLKFTTHCCESQSEGRAISVFQIHHIYAKAV